MFDLRLLMIQKVYFKSKYLLCGVLSVPRAADNRIVILCHAGGNSNKESRITLDLEKKFRKIGISTFRFDFTGHGESEGKKDFSILQGVEDIFSAMNFLKTKGYRYFVLLGGSRGAACALRATIRRKNVKCLVLISPASKYESFHERLAIAKSCRVPTLIIQGDMDKSVPLEKSRELCAVIPQCTLKIVKGANHRYTVSHTHQKRMSLAMRFIKKYF